MNEQDDHTACVCALVDISREDFHGLNGVEGKGLCIEVVDRLARRSITVDPEHMLKLIGRSLYADELLTHLPRAYLSLRPLRDVAYALSVGNFGFSRGSVLTFANHYWELAAKDRVKHLDFHGAWDVISIALLKSAAFESKLESIFRELVAGEPVGLPCSVETGQRMVREVHAAMSALNFVKDVLDEQRPEISQWLGNPFWPAGVRVAREIACNLKCRKRPTAVQLQALAIGRWFVQNQRQGIEIDAAA